MPTYEYRCTECGRELEVVQKFSDAALTECPTCTGALRKVYNAVGVVFKGSGFYRTDSRKGSSSDSGNGSSKDGGDSSSGSDGKKESTTKESSPKADSKPSGDSGSSSSGKSEKKSVPASTSSPSS